MMSKTKDCSTRIILKRISANGFAAEGYFEEASEVIVFGSVAAGLDRPDSDIDILCVGGRESKLKRRLLDLIIVPGEATRSHVWLQSELAFHVGKYGVWIKGSPNWIHRAHIGQKGIAEKRRRVEAFMRYLPASWSALDEAFKVKYSVKVRREAQRLLLLSRRVPVPPTKLLDTSWANFSESEHELHQVIHALAGHDRGEFFREFLSYFDENLHHSHA